MIDVLVVATATTSGWRSAAVELEASIARAGVTVETTWARPPRRVRTYALTDFAEARAARKAIRSRARAR